jgi:hypothetical protein
VIKKPTSKREKITRAWEKRIAVEQSNDITEMSPEIRGLVNEQPLQVPKKENYFCKIQNQMSHTRKKKAHTKTIIYKSFPLKHRHQINQRCQ